jgi:hypothetical protein
MEPPMPHPADSKLEVPTKLDFTSSASQSLKPRPFDLKVEGHKDKCATGLMTAAAVSVQPAHMVIDATCTKKGAT